jgi:hypothetical protein
VDGLAACKGQWGFGLSAELAELAVSLVHDAGDRAPGLVLERYRHRLLAR